MSIRPHNYKEGDRISFKTHQEMDRDFPGSNEAQDSFYPGVTNGFHRNMKVFLGKEAIITKIEHSRNYKLDFRNSSLNESIGNFSFSPEMFKPYSRSKKITQRVKRHFEIGSTKNLKGDI